MFEIFDLVFQSAVTSSVNRRRTVSLRSIQMMVFILRAVPAVHAVLVLVVVSAVSPVVFTTGFAPFVFTAGFSSISSKLFVLSSISFSTLLFEFATVVSVFGD